MSRQDWQLWRAERAQRLRGPLGPLALTGTHWFTHELVLDDLPGTWAAGDGQVTLTASAGDGVLVDGAPLDGTVPVTSDVGPRPTEVRVGDVRLVLIDRDGVAGVRVYDPDAVRRSGFEGIDAFDFDDRWVRPATFHPYAGERVVRVANVDGVDRPLPLGGDVVFDVEGTPVRLAVEVGEDGWTMAVLSDATSGRSTYRFRFLDLPPPDDEGRTTADLNRLRLPPCALSDHFVCPFPPPGNALDVALEAGERQARWSHGGH